MSGMLKIQTAHWGNEERWCDREQGEAGRRDDGECYIATASGAGEREEDRILV